MRFMIGGILLVMTLVLPCGGTEQISSRGVVPPELPTLDDWINSKPLKLGDLQGKVVVVYFWTFG